MNRVLNIFLKIFCPLLILIGAIFLRILYLDNGTGLTVNELDFYKQIFSIKDLSVFHDILHGHPIFSFYNLLISAWSCLLNDGTYTLRLLSVIFGVLTCFVGLFSENRVQGLVCLFLFSINSFLINYSQEVGYYSLLGLFAILNIVSLIKIKVSDKGHILWGLSVVGMALTSVFSLFFAIINFAVFSIYYRKGKFLKTGLISFSVLIPYFGYILYNYKKYINSYFSVNYDFCTVFGFVQNVFSPHLIELNGNNFIEYFYSLYKNINFVSLGFIVIPILIGLYFIFRAFIKDKFNIMLFLSVILYTIVRILLQSGLGIPFATGEYIIPLIIMLLLISRGVELNVVSLLLIVLFGAINLSFLFLQEESIFKQNKSGVLDFADMVNISLANNDFIYTWDKLNDVESSLDKKVTVYNLQDKFVNDSDILLENKKLLNNMTSKEKKEYLRNYFLIKKYPKHAVKQLNYMITALYKNNKIYVIYPKKYDFGYDKFLDIVSKDFLYYNYSESDLLTMHSIAIIDKMLSDFFYRRDEKDDFVINIYKK